MESALSSIRLAQTSKSVVRERTDKSVTFVKADQNQPLMFSPEPFRLTPSHQLHHLVEQRTAFDADLCQFNIFETHDKAKDFHLKFSGFTITSMLRGKKVMHLPEREQFEYVPGETVIASADTPMRIDFPEAHAHNPTQCTVLVIDDHYFKKQVAYINENHYKTSRQEWSIDAGKCYLKNSEELAKLSTRLIQQFSSNEPFKEVYIDLTMNLEQLNTSTDSSPFSEVMKYIRENLTASITLKHLCRLAGMSRTAFYESFTCQFGISPKQLIIRERLNYSKNLMVQEGLSIKEACYAAGFSDPNYFTRMFKKNEGTAPSSWLHGARKK
jgi:AraC-like DNA-binding protein